MKKLKNILTSVIALAMCSTCLMSTPLQVSAASTYAQGDVNGDGSVNSADITTVRQFLLGQKYTDGYTIQRIDVNNDCIVDENDAVLIKKIVTHLQSGSTKNYTTVNQNDLPKSTTKQYIKYQAKSGSLVKEYSLSAVSAISSASTRAIVGSDDRIKDYSNKGVVLLKYNKSGKPYVATGFVVDSHTIMTAAHCVFETENNIPVTNLTYSLYNSNGQTIDINGNYVNNKSYEAVSYHIPKDYYNASYYFSDNENANDTRNGFLYDYALITVNEDLSEYISFDLGVAKNSITSKNPFIYIAGYSSTNRTSSEDYTKTLIGHMVSGKGYLCSGAWVLDNTTYYTDKINNNNLYYNTDMVEGESGGPVYIENSDGSRTVIGINTGYYWYNVNNDNKSYNRGTRLSTNILSFVFNNPNL